jgi:hypothetical protein
MEVTQPCETMNDQTAQLHMFIDVLAPVDEAMPAWMCG